MDSTEAPKIDAELPAQSRLNGADNIEEPPAKKVKMEEATPSTQQNEQSSERQKGVAPIKAEYAFERTITLVPRLTRF